MGSSPSCPRPATRWSTAPMSVALARMRCMAWPWMRTAAPTSPASPTQPTSRCRTRCRRLTAASPPDPPTPSSCSSPPPATRLPTPVTSAAAAMNPASAWPSTAAAMRTSWARRHPPISRPCRRSRPPTPALPPWPTCSSPRWLPAAAACFIQLTSVGPATMSATTSPSIRPAMPSSPGRPARPTSRPSTRARPPTAAAATPSWRASRHPATCSCRFPMSA